VCHSVCERGRERLYLACPEPFKCLCGEGGWGGCQPVGLWVGVGVCGSQWVYVLQNLGEFMYAMAVCLWQPVSSSRLCDKINIIHNIRYS
jgi:hypothetical protein